MPRLREHYKTTKRILFGKGKAELAAKTGIGLRTLYNRAKEPEKTTARELALIAKEKELSTAEIMLVLEELAQ